MTLIKTSRLTSTPHSLPPVYWTSHGVLLIVGRSIHYRYCFLDNISFLDIRPSLHLCHPLFFPHIHPSTCSFSSPFFLRGHLLHFPFQSVFSDGSFLLFCYIMFLSSHYFYRYLVRTLCSFPVLSATIIQLLGSLFPISSDAHCMRAYMHHKRTASSEYLVSRSCTISNYLMSATFVLVSPHYWPSVCTRLTVLLSFTDFLGAFCAILRGYWALVKTNYSLSTLKRSTKPMTLQVNLGTTQATYQISPCVRAIPRFKFLILRGWQGIEIAKNWYTPLEWKYIAVL